MSSQSSMQLIPVFGSIDDNDIFVPRSRYQQTMHATDRASPRELKEVNAAFAGAFF